MADVIVDHAGFNADHYKNKSEKQFIDAELASVPDRVGDEKKKIAWLKEAYKIVVPKTDTVKPQDSKVGG